MEERAGKMAEGRMQGQIEYRRRIREGGRNEGEEGRWTMVFGLSLGFVDG